MRVLVVDLADGPRPSGCIHRTMSLSSRLLRDGVDVRWLLLRAGVSGEVSCRGYDIPVDRVTWVECLNRRFFVMAPFRGLGHLVDEADVICLSSFLSGAAPLAWLHARRRGTPWVVSPHGSVPYFGRSLALKWLAHAACGRAILRGAAGVVAVNDAERAAIAPWVGEKTTLRVIPNGIDVPMGSGRTAAADTPPNGAPHVLCLGRLSPEKGIDVLLEAWASVPLETMGNLRLVVAGDGPERTRLEAVARRLNVDSRVTFAGRVDGSAKQQLLHTAAFVAIPSRRDAMTLVALEAGAAGRPLLISRACGFPQAAACGGAVEATPTPDGLRTGLLQMLEARAEWPAMGRSLSDLVLREYLWSQQASRFRDLLESVVR